MTHESYIKYKKPYLERLTPRTHNPEVVYQKMCRECLLVSVAKTDDITRDGLFCSNCGNVLIKSRRMCTWSKCSVITKDENGNGYSLCDKHAEIKAQYNRNRYQAMLRAYKSQVRVTEEPSR